MNDAALCLLILKLVYMLRRSELNVLGRICISMVDVLPSLIMYTHLKRRHCIISEVDVIISLYFSDVSKTTIHPYGSNS